MKLTAPKLATAALLSATMLLFTGCTSTPEKNKTTSTDYQKGVFGRSMVQTYQTTAKVTALAPAARRVTLLTPDGSTNTFTASPEVALDAIHVGDNLNLTVAWTMAAYLDQPEPPTVPDAAAALRDTPGARPGVLTFDAVPLTATIKSVDLSKHQATFQLPDGRTAAFTIRQDVRLIKVKPGMKVLVDRTAAAVIMSEQPPEKD